MPKFLVDIWLDGYENEEEMVEACIEFIDEQLDMTASSVKIEHVPEHLEEKIENILKEEVGE